MTREEKRICPEALACSIRLAKREALTEDNACVEKARARVQIAQEAWGEIYQSLSSEKMK